MTINEVAGLLGYSKERVERLISDGLALPKSGAIVRPNATQQGSHLDISDDQFNEFVAKFEAEEPGRWPPVGVRRELLVEARHRCAICHDAAPLQFHHMLDWAKIKHHDARHMLAVCGTCHTRCTNGTIDYQTQIAYKTRLSQSTTLPHQAIIDPITKSEPTILAASLETKMPLAPQRLTIPENSAGEIFAHLKGTPPHLFFEKVKDLYIGRWTQELGWQVTVDQLPSKPSGGGWFCIFREVGSGTIVAASTIRDVSTLRPGDSVTVIGRISDVSPRASVILEDAQISSLNQ